MLQLDKLMHAPATEAGASHQSSVPAMRVERRVHGDDHIMTRTNGVTHIVRDRHRSVTGMIMAAATK